MTNWHKMVLFGTAAVMLAAGCSGAARKDRKAAAAAAKAAAGGAQGAGVGGPTEVEEASLRGKEFRAVETLHVVGFDYDKAELSESARETLKRNAEWLRKNEAVEIQIAGHCDERGTIEYNLALGQRRARAVRDYYRSLGIAPKRMATISYGKERPVCEESTESCWSRNRRAESLARIPPAPAETKTRRPSAKR